MGKLRADVAFAVTASATHNRCSAQPTSDKEGGPGAPFTLDGRPMVHCRQNRAPGAVAFHVTAASLVPLHEFSHAASSFSNGKITDLYQPADGLNKKRRRPIPPVFCVYNGQTFPSAPDRGGGIAYPPNSDYYHCAQADPAFPAVMDNYSMAAGGQALRCRHDTLTRAFLVDRIQSIMAR